MSDDNLDGVFGEGEKTEAPQKAEPVTSKKQAPRAASGKKAVKRVRIILAKNDEVPPSGLFLGHNGVGYNLKAGKAADVPEFLLDILDHAVVKRPVMDDNGRVKGYEDSPRFPYQVVRDKK